MNNGELRLEDLGILRRGGVEQGAGTVGRRVIVPSRVLWGGVRSEWGGVRSERRRVEEALLVMTLDSPPPSRRSASPGRSYGGKR